MKVNLRLLNMVLFIMDGEFMFFKNGLRKKEYIKNIEKYARVIEKNFFLSKDIYLSVNHYIFYENNNICICMSANLNKVALDKRTVIEQNEFIVVNSSETERWYLYSQIKMILQNISSKSSSLKNHLDDLNIKINFDNLFEYLNNYSLLERDTNLLNNQFRNCNFFELEIPFDISNIFEQKINENKLNEGINEILTNSFVNNSFQEEMFIIGMRKFILETKLDALGKVNICRNKSKI